MEEWIKLSLGAPTFSMSVLFSAFFLGLLGSVSSCCNLTVLAALIGYSGIDHGKKLNTNMLLAGLSFMFGTIIALAILGGVTGFVSQAVGSALGTYWKIFAGAVMVFFGTVSLDLLPFRLPGILPKARVIPAEPAKALLYGFAVGGGTTVCSVSCNPMLPVALSAAVLEGHTMRSAAILGSFAFGYSLPLAAGMLGLSFGVARLSAALDKYSGAIKTLAGVMLLGVGFYLLLTAGS